jgi:hypothetical protein
MVSRYADYFDKKSFRLITDQYLCQVPHSPKFGGMRGHRGIVALLVAFATGSSRVVPLPATKLLIGTGSDLDEFERPLPSIGSIVVEDTLPPAAKLGTTVG